MKKIITLIVIMTITTAFVLEAQVGEEIINFTGHDKAVTSIAFSPDGKYVLSGTEDKTLKLWDIATGEEIKTFSGHNGSINSVAFSPDGKYALSGSFDGILKLWNIAAGKERKSGLKERAPITEKRIALVTDDGVRIRKSFSVDAAVIGKLRKDEVVEILEKSPEKQTINGITDYWYKIRRQSDGFDIIIPGKLAYNLPLLGFSLFWLGFVSFWTVTAIEGFFPMAFFSIPFWCAGIVILGKAIKGFSKAKIRMDTESIEIKNSPFLPGKKYPLEHLSRVYSREIQPFQGRNRPGPAMHPTCGVKIELGAKTVVVDKNLSQSEAQWVAQVIEKYKQLYS